MSAAVRGRLETESSRATRWRTLAAAVSPCIALVVLVLAAAEYDYLRQSPMGRLLPGVDVTYYLEATDRWLTTGTPYLAHEVAADFTYSRETFLHPPFALYLFLPFRVLPIQLWWAIPVALIAWCMRSWRPGRWTWPLIALCLLWPRTQCSLIFGNTDVWVSAFVALGLRYGWPGLLVLIKPSFAPLMLVGSTSRSWWLGLWLIAIATIPFGRLWLDWFAVVQHAPGGADYSLVSLPIVLVPVVGWLGRRQRIDPVGSASEDPGPQPLAGVTASTA